MTQKWLKGFNNNVTQTKCYGKYCLCVCSYLIFVILYFTLFKFERFEGCLSPRLFIFMTTRVNFVAKIAIIFGKLFSYLGLLVTILDENQGKYYF